MENKAKIVELSNEAKNLLMEFYENQNVLEYINSTKDGR